MYAWEDNHGYMTRKSRPELFLFLNYFEERQHAMIMTYQEVFSYVPQKTQQHNLLLRPYLSLSFTRLDL